MTEEAPTGVEPVYWVLQTCPTDPPATTAPPVEPQLYDDAPLSRWPEATGPSLRYVSADPAR